MAFIAPDFPQTRQLYANLKARSAAQLAEANLELRFEAVPDESGEPLERRMAEIVRASPRVLLAAAERIAVSAKRHAGRTPIIFATRSDPVRSGLVASAAQPGGTVTGFTYDIDVESKQLELLKELVPGARTIGVLNDGPWLDERIGLERLRGYEATMGIRLEVFTGATAEDMPRLVLGAKGRKVDAWLVPIHNLTGNARVEIVRAMREARRPAVYGRSSFVEAGGLASYEERIVDPMGIWHELLVAVLKGVPPGIIPVRRPKDFEMVLNVGAAERLGLRLDRAIIRRADRVVDVR